MTELRQTIMCPCCEGEGWVPLAPITAPRQRSIECPVCDRRGFLVIDHEATQAQGPKPKPRRKRTEIGARVKPRRKARR